MKLLDRYFSVAIDVKHAESNLETLTREERVVIERCHEELSIVDLAIAICVDSLDDFLDFILVEIDTLNFLEGYLELLR